MGINLKQATKTYAPAKCAWCSGTGKWNVIAGKPTSCIVCGGKGHVSIAQPAGYCQQCQGSGRRGNVNPCFNCAGTGWEHVSGQG